MFQLNRIPLHSCISNLIIYREAKEDQPLHVQKRGNAANQPQQFVCDCSEPTLGALRPQDAIQRFEEGINWCIEEDNEPFNFCCDILHDCQVRCCLKKQRGMHFSVFYRFNNKKTSASTNKPPRDATTKANNCERARIHRSVMRPWSKPRRQQTGTHLQRQTEEAVTETARGSRALKQWKARGREGGMRTEGRVQCWFGSINGEEQRELSLSSKHTSGHRFATVSVSSWTRARHQGDSAPATIRQVLPRGQGVFTGHSVTCRGLRKTVVQEEGKHVLKVLWRLTDLMTYTQT